MRMVDALRKSRQSAGRDAPEYRVTLVSGCTALSLVTYVTAHLGELSDRNRFTVTEAPYGDLVNSLQSAYAANSNGLVILIEYSTLDPRLGTRRAAGLREEDLVDIVKTVKIKLGMILSVIAGSSNRRTVLHPPALSLLPISKEGSWQIGQVQASISLALAEFMSSAAALPGVFIAAPKPELLLEGRNVDGEITADFPYSQTGASYIAESVAQVLVPPPALKGIITDLDDTLWRGLVGEVGPEGIHWNLDGKSQMHAVYQQFLSACAGRGILVAIVSKNDQKVVDKALKRPDILLSEKDVFPIIANWEPKSKAVQGVLSAWNIGADAVVFVDDNEYELDEVKRAFPQIKTLRFPTHDADAILKLIAELRDLCFKEFSSEEDRLRLSSLRQSADFKVQANNGESMEEFLRDLNAKILLEVVSDREERRAFELVNKTNQFNLNGRRYTESEWDNYLSDSDKRIISISYSDKFGNLGKIGVVLLTLGEDNLALDQWVLSCRAFARRIEFATLNALLDTFSPSRLTFAYQKTEKNGPLTQFLKDIRFEVMSEKPHDLRQYFPVVYASVLSNLAK